jgi:hypothetical protein
VPSPVRCLLAPSIALAVSLAWTAPAHAQPAQPDGYFGAAAQPMTFEVDRPRTREAKVLIASLFGAAVVFTGGGLLFHLHSKSQSDEVSTETDEHTGRVYTDDLDATRRDAERSRTLAIAGYAVGGGFLVGTLVAYLLTDPGTETIRVGEEQAEPPAPSGRPQVLVEPSTGGGMVGAAWRF